MGRKRSQNITLTERQKITLERIVAMKTTQVRYQQRVQIVLKSVCGKTNSKIAMEDRVERSFVQRWLTRWDEAKNELKELEAEDKDHKYLAGILKIFTDEERSGSPAKFTAEQVCNIIAISCEKPEDSDLPISHWSRRSIAVEAVKRKVVTSISMTQVGRFLKSSRP